MTIKQTSIAKGTMIFTGSVLLSRVLGLLRNWLLAYVGGTSAEVDAYNFAFLIPNLLNHLLASGYLSITLVPLILPLLKEGKTQEASRAFSNIFTVTSFLMIVFSIFCWMGAEWLLPYLSHKPIAPEVLDIAVRYTRIIIFGQVFFVAGGLFMGVQHSTYSYFLPALAPLIYNISIIVGGLFSLNGNGVEGFCWGVLVGAFLGSGLIQYIGVRRSGLSLSLRVDLKDPLLRRYFVLSMPFIVAAGMTFSNEFVYLFFGMDNKNSVSILGYALRIAMVIVGVFGMAVSVASYPHMTRLCSEKKYGEVNKLAAGTLDKVFSLLVPSALLLIAFSEPVIKLVYNYGKFEAVQDTALALRWYLVAALPMSAQMLVVRPLYADQRTWLPSFITLILFLGSLPLYVVIPDSIGIIKIPLISSLLSITQFLAIFGAWLMLYPDRVYITSLVTLMKVVVPSILLYWIGMELNQRYLIAETGRIMLLVKTMIFGFGLLGMTFSVMYILKVEPVIDLMEKFSRSLKAKFKF